MRYLVLGLGLFLAACDGPVTHADVAAYNNAADHAWCLDIGIARDDARYAECRIVAADLRLQGLQSQRAMAAAMIGSGAYAIGSSQPAHVTIIDD